MSHGFLNVFVAAIAGWRTGATAEEIEAMLLEENLNAFDLEDDRLRIGRSELSIDDVVEGRERLALSFGSCSFDEPLEDLRRMDLLEQEKSR